MTTLEKIIAVVLVFLAWHYFFRSRRPRRGAAAPAETPVSIAGPPTRPEEGESLCV